MIKTALRRWLSGTKTIYQNTILVFVVLSTLHFVTPVEAQTAINGAGKYEEFGKATLILKFDLGIVTDTSTFALSQDTEKNLSIRLLENRTARSWSQLWIQSLSINNPTSVLNAQAETLVSMTKLMPSELKQGDLIRFSRVSNDLTQVHLNEVKLADFETPGFFDFLLTAFIGKTPPSSALKSKLLAAGVVDPETISLFELLNYSEDRKNEIRQWAQTLGIQTTKISDPPKQPARSQNNTQPNDGSQTVADSQTIADSQIIDNTEERNSLPTTIADTASIDEPIPDSRSLVTTTRTETTRALEPLENTTEPFTSNSEAPYSQVSSSNSDIFENSNSDNNSLPVDDINATEPPQISDEEVATQDEDAENSEEVPEITAESIFAIQKYQREAARQIYANIRYPRNALRRDLEGEVRVAITISRDGTLYDINLIQSAQFDGFNQAALDAIDDAMPFPRLPASIQAPLKIEVPLKFQLQ